MSESLHSNYLTHLISFPPHDARRLSLLHLRTLGTALARPRGQRSRPAGEHRARVSHAHGRSVHAGAVCAGVHAEPAEMRVIIFTDYAGLHIHTA